MGQNRSFLTKEHAAAWGGGALILPLLSFWCLVLKMKTCWLGLIHFFLSIEMIYMTLTYILSYKMVLKSIHFFLPRVNLTL